MSIFEEEDSIKNLVKLKFDSLINILINYLSASKQFSSICKVVFKLKSKYNKKIQNEIEKFFEEISETFFERIYSNIYGMYPFKLDPYLEEIFGNFNACLPIKNIS